MKKEQNLVSLDLDKIESKIYFIRGKKVMLDSDLASLYRVETKNLNKSIKRNIARFPEDFMFQLSREEFKRMRFQIGTSKKTGRGGHRYLPHAFTEQGVAMLSSILDSERAVQVNIQIIRTFTKIRQILSENAKLAEKLEEMENKYDSQISKIFEIIRRLVIEEEKPKTPIGFNTD